MKKLNLILWIFLSVLTHTIYGQTVWLDAKVITNEMDTLSGKIFDKGIPKTPQSVDFVSDKGVELELTPQNTYKIISSDLTLWSQTVDHEISASHSLEAMSDSSGVETKNEQLFVKKIIGGSRPLYMYRSTTKSNFYIFENEKLVLLKYKVYKKDISKTESIRYAKAYNKMYLGQLSYYFRGHPKTISKIKYTKHHISSLQRLFEVYQKEVGESEVIDVVKMKVKFGITAGQTSSSINFEGPMQPVVRVENYSRSSAFYPGISLDIILPVKNQKWSIYNEFGLINSKYEGQYQSSHYTHDVMLDFNYFQMMNMARYTFYLSESSKLFLNFGLTNSFMMNSKTERWVSYNLDSNRPPDLNEAFIGSDPRSHSMGLIGGLGFRYKKIGIEYRYESNGGPSPWSSVKSTISRNYFVVNFQIN
ncbi:hypothetical protein KMW28_04470 [Flammeovirga yaeyamensis]|uniref:Outer membrane protein beta-barrel domain-containing protein n=1 Tax=Flammeovirga yaeyamensis TaxID=367791 RepID=A0AAX1NA28_9BACT|nr:hypothetical protein [Flammeovirga yaeyamensis]MBB3697411.1 hypothetical protein [Flammeovirga yaeyamensis]NMF36105.1 hypothetical protein [Flammeovirga yaeyamensis]QWG02838.1 hypothetical protein KMW28_04470 [Flammeovirga yaeyamensis]